MGIFGFSETPKLRIVQFGELLNCAVWGPEIRWNEQKDSWKTPEMRILGFLNTPNFRPFRLRFGTFGGRNQRETNDKCEVLYYIRARAREWPPVHGQNSRCAIRWFRSWLPKRPENRHFFTTFCETLTHFCPKLRIRGFRNCNSWAKLPATDVFGNFPI